MKKAGIMLCFGNLNRTNTAHIRVGEQVPHAVVPDNFGCHCGV